MRSVEIVGVIAALTFALVPCGIAYADWLYTRREKK
jgi:hypothetical protein